MPAFTTLLLPTPHYSCITITCQPPPAPHSPRLLCQQRVVLCRFICVALRCAGIGHGWFAQERMPVVTSLAGHAASPMGPSHPLHPLLCAKSFYPYQASPFLLSGKSFNLLWPSPTTLPPFDFIHIFASSLHHNRLAYPDFLAAALFYLAPAPHPSFLAFYCSDLILPSCMQLHYCSLLPSQQITCHPMFLATLVALHLTPVSKWASGQIFELA